MYEVLLRTLKLIITLKGLTSDGECYNQLPIEGARISGIIRISTLS